MTRRWFAGVMAAGVVGTGLPGIAAAQPGPAPGAVLPDASVRDLPARLAALTPSDPMGYFLLAEEVAAEAGDAPGKNLARRLYVLAYELDRRKEPGGPASDTATPERSAGTAGGVRFALGPSVCLGLAELAPREDERRWLLALARLLGPGLSGEATAGGHAGLGDDPQGASFDLATVLGLTRAGEGRRAQKLLDDPSVNALLGRYERLLSPVGLEGGAARVRRWIGLWPTCPECHNGRAVTRTGENPRVEFCTACGGNPGPTLTQDELMYHLRLEAVLLNGVHQSWSAQVVTDEGAPLRELDPAELARTYDVDVTKPSWRDGAWVGSTDAGAEAVPVEPPAAPQPEPPAPPTVPTGPVAGD